MSPWIRNGIVVASLFLIMTNDNSAEAHIFQRLFNRGGMACSYPQHGRCGHRCKKLARRYFRRCAPVTSCCPGVCTPPPPQICYQDIICTEYRMVPRTTNVPVTTYKQITVDEGCWQRVWVPKMVTKQIQCTQYQKQTSYVRTPIQVRKRVQVTVPQSTCTDCMNGQPSMMSPSPSMQPYIVPSTPTPSSAPVPTPMSNTSLDMGAYPTLAPTISAQPAAGWGGNSGPAFSTMAATLPPSPAVLQVPDLQSNSEWQTIPSQNSYFQTQTAVSNQSTYDDSLSRTASAKGAFVPAPSAATVWNTPRRQRLN
ncbi:hypothetical protein [Gimesia algae]|uniref:Uncharacterized protein n=1 Tax=Gimesia algae TaxID=2527971 RepID=A0A517VD81_9PLAN|nr:hypothetical protein [Gimesia algae]QDT90961.1 hypothetical protein Pan161_26150 [Gimesia algae]